MALKIITRPKLLTPTTITSQKALRDIYSRDTKFPLRNTYNEIDWNLDICIMIYSRRAATS